MVILILIKIINELYKNKSVVQIEMPLAAGTGLHFPPLRIVQLLAHLPLTISFPRQRIRTPGTRPGPLVMLAAEVGLGPLVLSPPLAGVYASAFGLGLVVDDLSDVLEVPLLIEELADAAVEVGAVEAEGVEAGRVGWRFGFFGG